MNLLIPEEIMFEIFSWLPVKSLLRFKCSTKFCFEPEEKKFKVFSRYKERHWVFTLGIDESWRENKNISFAIPYFKPSVCISGVIYQLINGAIAAIDIKSEKCETIALWNSSHESPNYYELIEVKGKLEVIDYRKWVGGYLDLWILEQTPQRKWERHIIRLPSIWNPMKPGFVSSVMSRDGEIVFVVIFKSGGACLCYDVTRKSWRELKIMGLPKENYIKGIYSYVESLVSLG
ncbi:hypothetical protein MTR67_001027 [Solanum verrucosum]|uniref:F-box associated beta-propeller type 3 domain-containing protein n=1 Tax=Solanum verrucosum TaxID=315347 RepID=A0AAF0T4P7_SOLVR|nr:hypothetical protein MTR67_001027 [Solanum verrucosum]